MFPSRHKYGVRYCQAEKSNWGWSYKGACNMDELRLILNQTIWIRRLKQEVLKQLPAKIRKMVYLKIPELKSEKKKQNKNFMDQFANIENLSAGIGLIILDQSNHSITVIN